MIRSSVGRLRHKIRKFPVEIFHNANNRPQTLRQILRMVTIDIAIKLTLMAVHTLRYTLPVMHCLRGDAFFYSNYLLPPGATKRKPAGIFLLSSQKNILPPSGKTMS